MFYLYWPKMYEGGEHLQNDRKSPEFSQVMEKLVNFKQNFTPKILVELHDLQRTKIQPSKIEEIQTIAHDERTYAYENPRFTNFIFREFSHPHFHMKVPRNIKNNLSIKSFQKTSEKSHKRKIRHGEHAEHHFFLFQLFKTTEIWSKLHFSSEINQNL